MVYCKQQTPHKGEKKMILTKITSSMEKCFLDGNIADYAELTHLSALKNERISFQLLYTDDTVGATIPYRADRKSVV